MIRSKVLVRALAAAALVSACSGGGDSSTTTTTEPGGDAVELLVPPELEEVAGALAGAYAAEGAGREVAVVLEGEEELVASVAEGRPDLVVAPDAWLTDPALERVPVGRGLLVIVVPEGNPGGVTGAEAFAADSGLDTVVCGEDSPIGNPALLVLSAAGVTPDPTTVRPGCDAEAAQQVADGELDAALIFRAGVVMPDGAETVALPADGNLVIELFSVSLSDAGADLAAFLTGDTAQQILTERGYLP